MKYENKDFLTESQTKERTRRLNEAYKELVYRGLIQTHADVAALMGATRPSVSAALSGNPRFLTTSFLRRFATAFSEVIDSQWLLSGQGEMLIGVGKQKETSPPASAQPDSQAALLAAKDELIQSLREQIAAQDQVIQAKDELIRELRHNHSSCYQLDIVADKH